MGQQLIKTVSTELEKNGIISNPEDCEINNPEECENKTKNKEQINLSSKRIGSFTSAVTMDEQQFSA